MWCTNPALHQRFPKHPQEMHRGRSDAILNASALFGSSGSSSDDSHSDYDDVSDDSEEDHSKGRRVPKPDEGFPLEELNVTEVHTLLLEVSSCTDS